MKKILLPLILVGCAVFAAQAAEAQIVVGPPAPIYPVYSGYAAYPGYAYPQYYAPAPVIVAPPPMVVAPAPVFYRPYYRPYRVYGPRRYWW